MAAKAKIGVLGASGYTGGELVRVLLRHPRAEIVLLTAERSAGKAMRDVFPQFSPFTLPQIVAIDGIDWRGAALDVAFCALPHATTQKVIKDLMAKSPSTKVVDLSADFRLSDTAAYAKWYGHDHHAPAVHAIDDDAGHRPDDGDRQVLRDHHPGDSRGRSGEVEQERVHSDGIEPVAELGDRLAEEEQPEVPIGTKKREVHGT